MRPDNTTMLVTGADRGHVTGTTLYVDGGWHVLGM